MELTATSSSTSLTITYARARLWLGITSVGSIVTIAATMLILELPATLFGGVDAGWAAEIISLLTILAGYALISLPFDLMGGYWLPQRFERPVSTKIGFARAWSRGVLVQVFLMVLIGMVILRAGRLGGIGFSALVVGSLMLLVVAFQEQLAKVVGGLRAGAASHTPKRTRIVKADDESFVGGYSGLPRLERLILPEKWIEELDREQLETQITRRRSALQTKSRTRGLFLAFAWNMIGFLICGIAPGGEVTSISGLLTLALWFTLWSFLGLITLPTPSRAGVYEADHHALRNGASMGALEATMRALDRWQEDEPSRRDGIEAIFHPVPSVTNRLERLCAGTSKRGTYHAARMALPMSWACLGFLGRAVHCNCGRPGLWVMLPGD